MVSFLNVISDKQESVNEYVKMTYNKVQVTVQGKWMRLDFDNDGSVSVEDLKLSMVGLFDFLKNFDLIEKTTQIKSKLYSDAIAYMQKELDIDQRVQDSKK